MKSALWSCTLLSFMLVGTFTVVAENAPAVNPPVRITWNNSTGHALFSCLSSELFTSLAEEKPGEDKLCWNGTRDLSAFVYMFHPNAEYFSLRVVVEDDVHNQPFHGLEMFNGDSLQLMLLLPNQKDPWEIGVSWHNDNSKEAVVRMAPPEFDKTSIAKEIKITAYLRNAADQTVSKTVIWYEIKIPLKAVGTSLDELKSAGFRFNLMINDNDGACLKGRIAIIPKNTQNQDQFKVILLGPKPANG